MQSALLMWMPVWAPRHSRWIDRVFGDARNNVIYGNNAYAGAAQAYVDDIFSFTDFSRAFDQGIADGDDLVRCW